MAMPTAEDQRASYLKCWKKWMLHGSAPNSWDGWFIVESSDSLAAGW